MSRYVNNWKVSWTVPDNCHPDRDLAVAQSRRFRADLETLTDRAADAYPELQINSLDGVEQPESEDDEPVEIARYAQLDPGPMVPVSSTSSVSTGSKLGVPPGPARVWDRIQGWWERAVVERFWPERETMSLAEDAGAPGTVYWCKTIGLHEGEICHCPRDHVVYHPVAVYGPCPYPPPAPFISPYPA